MLILVVVLELNRVALEHHQHLRLELESNLQHRMGLVHRFERLGGNRLDVKGDPSARVELLARPGELDSSRQGAGPGGEQRDDNQ